MLGFLSVSTVEAHGDRRVVCREAIESQMLYDLFR